MLCISTSERMRMVKNDRKHINFNLSWLGNTVINNNFSPLNDNISPQLRTHGHDNCRPFFIGHRPLSTFLLIF